MIFSKKEDKPTIEEEKSRETITIWTPPTPPIKK